MEKSTFTHEYRVLTQLLRALREASGVTQVEIAERLGTTQSILSKWERGERRLDLVQLRLLCRAMGTSLPKLVEQYEARLAGRSAKR